MTVRETLNQMLNKLPEERLGQLLEFAEFLASRTEQMEWRAFGREQFAKAYGTDEPEYTVADVKLR